MDKPTYYPDWLICQRCGRSEDPKAKDAKHWLVSGSRTVANLYIVRCPEHITARVLQESRAGRSREMKEKMRYGREVWAKQHHHTVITTPIPPGIIGADGRGH